jgi:MFS family permease
VLDPTSVSRASVRQQLGLQLLQVFGVGATLGTTRTVLPPLAEQEFGLAHGSFVALAAFVIVFGLVKAALNFVAGGWSDAHGRRRVLIAGWLCALPIPPLLYFAHDWSAVVVACALLGVNQGLCWSASQLAKLDLVGPERRGFAVGLDEFGGYLGVAAAGWATALLVAELGPRATLAGASGAVIVGSLLMAVVLVRDAPDARTRGAVDLSRRGFVRWSWGDPRMLALNQAGLVEKFVDAAMWLLLPVWLHARGVALAEIGLIAAAYGASWGVAQLATGPLSDRVGRDAVIVPGMWLCGLGLGALPWLGSVAAWSASAALCGLGMAMLYPTLVAAVADHASAEQRGTALGAYRFWRDLGYAVGALAIALLVEHGGGIEPAFLGVALAMGASGVWLALSQLRRRRP